MTDGDYKNHYPNNEYRRYISQDLASLAVLSFKVQSADDRTKLYDAFTEIPFGYHVEFDLNRDISLTGKATNKYSSGLILDTVYRGISFSAPSEFIDFIFNDCVFKRCIFKKTSFINSSFINCTFYDCFEIQFRTTLSEGWHEVDHTLRYKCKSDWDDYDNESRMLNGVFASLETNDRALKALFDDMSYNHYKKGNWEGMLRMKFRLQFDKKELSLSSLLAENKRLAKRIFRFDRIDLISKVAKSGLHVPVSFDNIVYLIIYLENHDLNLDKIIPSLLVENFESCNIRKNSFESGLR